MYIVNNINFKTKEEVKKRSKDILNNNVGVSLVGEELNFFKDLIKNHQHKYNADDVVGIDVRYIDGNQKLLGISVGFSKKDKVWSELVSIKRSIDGLTPINVVEMDFIIPFGKYNGMNIKDVNDEKYLWWVVHESNINVKYKIWVKQYMKYGFIPVNDHGFIDKQPALNKTDSGELIMMFGKYKGMCIKNIENTKYLEWVSTLNKVEQRDKIIIIKHVESRRNDHI
jgi:uncharacterized protein (DUF3820 family)